MCALTADRTLKMLSRSIDDYPEGIILPIDKPYRWTSADVIRKIKFAAVKHFGKKNLKVGHAGTLDPLATGVLIVCIGKATKLAEEIQKSDKEYIAGISFGATTPSYDLEKPIDRIYSTDGVSEESVRKALISFIGEQEQVAPLFSAKSVDGVRAYELARKLYRSGGQLDEEAAALLSRQKIRISKAELLHFEPSIIASSTGNSRCPIRSGMTEEMREDGGDQGKRVPTIYFHEEETFPLVAKESDRLSGAVLSDRSGASGRINVTDNSGLGLPRAEVRIACSKGTYVRAFARDLGEALGTGAHLDSLQRSKCGAYSVEDALSLEEALALLGGARPKVGRDRTEGP